jgi:hypothetical protein
VRRRRRIMLRRWGRRRRMMMTGMNKTIYKNTKYIIYMNFSLLLE